MRLILFILLFFGVNNQNFSQFISGIVKDVNGVSLPGVNIINLTNNFGVVSNSEGEFLIKATTDDVIRFSYVGKETFNYKLSEEDTVFIEINLKEKFSQLNSFTVNGKRIKRVSVKFNDNILDYESVGSNTFLILKRSKREYQITLEGVDTIYKVYPLIDLKPQKLFLDVFGNYHLICKDSVRQLYLDTNLKFISTISRARFISEIKPLVYTNYAYLLRYRMSSDNKRYSLYKNSSLFYEVTDSVSSAYRKEILYGRKNVKSDIASDEPRNKIRKSREQMETSFFVKNVLNRRIKVETYVINERAFVFNLEFKLIHKLNLNNEVEENNVLEKEYDKIVLDKEQNTFYGYSLHRGVVSLDKIKIETGEILSSFRLYGISFPKQLKIIDGWVYFIKINKHNFNKLRRVAIT